MYSDDDQHEVAGSFVQLTQKFAADIVVNRPAAGHNHRTGQQQQHDGHGAGRVGTQRVLHRTPQQPGERQGQQGPDNGLGGRMGEPAVHQ